MHHMQLHRSTPSDAGPAEGPRQESATAFPPQLPASPRPTARDHEESIRRVSGQRGPADSAAAALADKPRLWRAMLFAHQPDRHGHCIACLGVTWPCGPRRLAEQAEHIYNARNKNDQR